MIDLAAIRVTLDALADALHEKDLEGARPLLERYVAEARAQLGQDLEPVRKAKPTAGTRTTTPGRDLRRWLRSYVKLFTEWELEDAKLVAEQPPKQVPSRLARAPGLVRSGTQAALDGRHVDSREMLDMLLGAQDDAVPPRHLIGASRRAQLAVYLGRTCLLNDADTERASSCFTAAARLSPDDPVVHSALGDLHRAQHEEAEALQSYQHAVAVGPRSPDGYVGMGLLSEDAQRHDEAADWFDRALDMLDGRFDRAARLLAPVPAGLLLAQARRTETADRAAALEFYDAALEKARQGGFELCARIQAARAQLLAESDPAAAAHADFEAATLVDVALERRIELLRQAIALDPSHAQAQWELADGLRLQALGDDQKPVAGTLLGEAIDAWDRGSAVSPPARDQSWVYTSRALIHERLAQLSPDDASGQLWAAASWLEQAIAIDEGEWYRWMHLSRILRSLDLRANAVAVSAGMVELQPYDNDALLERCDALLDAGEPEAAVDAIAPALEQQPGPWTVVTAAWASFEAERVEEALDTVADALTLDDSELEGSRVSLLALQGRCLHRLARFDEELSVQEQIVELSEGNPDQRHNRAWALYVLGRAKGDAAQLEEAVATFAQLAGEDPRDRWSIVNGGLVRLASGELDAANDIVAGADQFRIAKEYRDLVDDLTELRADGDQSLHDVVDELVGVFTARAAQTRLATPEEELDARAQEPAARIATELARARLRRAAGDWEGALAPARSLHGELAETIRQGLAELVASGATNTAIALLASGSPADARDALGTALDASRDTGSDALTASAQAPLALALLRLGDDDGAQAAVARAVSALADGGEHDPARAFWELCSWLAEPDEIWALDELLPESTATDGSARPIHAARYLPRLSAGEVGGEPLHDPRPVVRLGELLVPEDTGPTWSLFSRHMPAMRSRVEADTGIILPGSSFRGGPHLTPSEFEIVIAGLVAERAPVPATTPGEPIEVVVEQLELAMRRRLEEFVTFDGAMRQLRDAQPDGRAAPLAGRAGKLRVSAIMRALAADHVPLTELELIARGAAEHADARTAVKAIRLQLAHQLPGIDAERLLELPDGMPERIDAAFDLGAGTLQAAASPLAADELERELAELVAAADATSLAIVTERRDLRRLVQRLVRRHHPDVPVLSLDEVAAVRPAEAATGEELHA